MDENRSKHCLGPGVRFGGQSRVGQRQHDLLHEQVALCFEILNGIVDVIEDERHKQLSRCLLGLDLLRRRLGAIERKPA